MSREGGSEEGGRTSALPFEEAASEFSLGPDNAPLIQLMEEFRRRQRRRPDLVVRPWWAPPGKDHDRLRVGFVVEYCPHGRESADLVVRGDRVTVDGPTGATEATLDLDGTRWGIDGRDAGCPETLTNYLLRMADRALETPKSA